MSLISAIRPCDIGCRFEGNSTVIVFKNTKGKRLYACRRANTNQLWTVHHSNSSCLSVSTDIMYQRLGNLHSVALRQFGTTGGKSSGMCTPCIFEKSHCPPFPSLLPQADQMLYPVHSDVVGPFQTPTPNGNRFFVTFIDEHSQFTKVYLMKHKSDILDIFKDYLAESERQTGKGICILKCDRGAEYTSTHF